MVNIAFALVRFFGVFAALPTETAPGKPEEFLLAPTVEDNRTYILTTGAARYAFIAPGGWSVNPVPETREVVMASEEGAASIKISFNDSNALPCRSSEVWLKELVELFAGARLIEKEKLVALARSVNAYDLEWVQGDRAKSGRFMQVSLNPGCLQFSLICDGEAFGRFLPSLTQLITSLKTGSLGRPVAIRRLQQE